MGVRGFNYDTRQVEHYVRLYTASAFQTFSLYLPSMPARYMKQLLTNNEPTPANKEEFCKYNLLVIIVTATLSSDRPLKSLSATL